MPNMQQFAYFFAFLIAGLVFLVIAFSLFLPVIILAPNKFAISFTIASGFIMAAPDCPEGLAAAATAYDDTRAIAIHSRYKFLLQSRLPVSTKAASCK